MHRMKGYLSGLFLALFAIMAMAATQAQAALDLTGVTVDTADYFTIAAFLVGALVAFWGVKKGLGLLGR